jgi:hypothetical protein
MPVVPADRPAHVFTFAIEPHVRPGGMLLRLAARREASR